MELSGPRLRDRYLLVGERSALLSVEAPERPAEHRLVVQATGKRWLGVIQFERDGDGQRYTARVPTPSLPVLPAVLMIQVTALSNRAGAEQTPVKLAERNIVVLSRSARVTAWFLWILALYALLLLAVVWWEHPPLLYRELIGGLLGGALLTSVWSSFKSRLTQLVELTPAMLHHPGRALVAAGTLFAVLLLCPHLVFRLVNDSGEPLQFRRDMLLWKLDALDADGVRVLWRIGVGSGAATEVEQLALDYLKGSPKFQDTAPLVPGDRLWNLPPLSWVKKVVVVCPRPVGLARSLSRTGGDCCESETALFYSVNSLRESCRSTMQAETTTCSGARAMFNSAERSNTAGQSEESAWIEYAGKEALSCGALNARLQLENLSGHPLTLKTEAVTGHHASPRGSSSSQPPVLVGPWVAKAHVPKQVESADGSPSPSLPRGVQHPVVATASELWVSTQALGNGLDVHVTLPAGHDAGEQLGTLSCGLADASSTPDATTSSPAATIRPSTEPRLPALYLSLYESAFRDIDFFSLRGPDYHSDWRPDRERGNKLVAACVPPVGRGGSAGPEVEVMLSARHQPNRRWWLRVPPRATVTVLANDGSLVGNVDCLDWSAEDSREVSNAASAWDAALLALPVEGELDHALVRRQHASRQQNLSRWSAGPSANAGWLWACVPQGNADRLSSAERSGADGAWTELSLLGEDDGREYYYRGHSYARPVPVGRVCYVPRNGAQHLVGASERRECDLADNGWLRSDYAAYWKKRGCNLSQLHVCPRK